jgi:hypothetical protein
MAKRAAKTTTRAPRSAPAKPAPASTEGQGASRPAGRRGKGFGPRKSTFVAGSAKGKHLVIVESPAKAKTINKYLGPEYVVLASRRPCARPAQQEPQGREEPRARRRPEHDFKPNVRRRARKRKRCIADLKRAAKDARDSGTRSGSQPTWIAREKPSRGTSRRRSASRARTQARDVRRDHEGRDRPRVLEAAPHRRRPRERPAGAPHPRPHRGLSGLAPAVEEGRAGPLCRARAERRGAPGG